MGGIGSGAKPRAYDDNLVRLVAHFYRAGYTQAEIAGKAGTSQKVVFNLMRRHGISTRVAAKRDQRGEKNHMWKGEGASYQAMHHRLTNLYGQPKECRNCGATDPEKSYDWANMTGDYNDIHDYVRLCRSCHRRYDRYRARGGGATC